MHVSYAEMVRAAPEVLRMLGGSPYGLAAEAVEALMMTHAALDKAYALTRLAATGSTGPWTTRVVAADDATLRVDCSGAPLVLYAGILADAAAVKPGCRRLLVSGANGGWVVPYMAYRLARRGVNCHGSWKASAGRPVDEAPALLVTAGCDGDGRRATVTIAEAEDAAPLPDGVCIELAGAIRPQAARVVDFEDAVRAFMTEGRQVDAEEHRRDFMAVAARIRTASSERSRAQAG